MVLSRTIQELNSINAIDLKDVNETRERICVSQSMGKAVLNVDNKLTEEFFRGVTFLAYDNPSPTTINEKKTNTARSLVSLTTSATSAIVISQDEKKTTPIKKINIA